MGFFFPFFCSGGGDGFFLPLFYPGAAGSSGGCIFFLFWFWFVSVWFSLVWFCVHDMTCTIEDRKTGRREEIPRWHAEVFATNRMWYGRGWWMHAWMERTKVVELSWGYEDAGVVR